MADTVQTLPVKTIDVLGRGICPWLAAPLAELEAARASERLGHAWLITGPAGVGKLNLALAFATRLLAGCLGERPPPAIEPEAVVAAMRERHRPADHHPDLHWIYPPEDKRAIGIEQIRSVSDVLHLTSQSRAAKLVIIEPAESMTTPAANALLKTLEEPTPETYLMLVSHQPGTLPGTIRSRCQTLSINAPARAAVAAWLASIGDVDELPDPVARLGPIRCAQHMIEGNISLFNKIDEKLTLIHGKQLDPQALADEWMKQDLDLHLEWLIGRLQSGIRARFSPAEAHRGPNPGNRSLQNPWTRMTLRTMFEQLAAAEKLRDRAGGGIDEKLALRVLLLGFVAGRDR